MGTRILQLGLALLVLVSQHAPAINIVAHPDPRCQSKCGDVEIQYPFGVGEDCSLEMGYFNVSCQVQDGVSRPFIGNLEILSISLTHGTIRMLNHISTNCYNASSGLMETTSWMFNASNTPYRFSDAQNKFTVIGCNTLAYIASSNGAGYQSGCVSTCGNFSDLADGSCSGVGCCQTAIPSGMDFYGVGFDGAFNTSAIWRSSRCSYAVLMVAAAFNFSAAYINTARFNDTSAGRAPVVMDWAIRDETTPSCDAAKLNETGTYACVSSNSACVDATNGPGYLCNCSHGYEGNPYLLGGCQDVDECNHSPCPSSGGVCHNTIGGYWCSCRVGRKYSKESNTCDPDTSIIIGNILS